MKIIEICVAEDEGGGLYGREKICSSLFYELRASDTQLKPTSVTGKS
jgi:hypothetical protein